METTKFSPLLSLARNARRRHMEMQCDPQWVLDLAAERDALLAELERTDTVRVHASIEAQQSSNEVQQDRIDALRYRVIRDSLAGGGRHTETPCVVHPLNSGVTYTPEGLDAVLDEIRSQADCSHL